MEIKLVIVIPTRNRADLAENAVNSVLSQDALPLAVIVSDNSTSEPERQKLQQFCAGTADQRLHYIAPPSPLSMTQHYNWAFPQAMEMFPTVDHFSLLTDRMIFRRDQLPELLALVARYPDRIITYNHDRVNDYAPPVRLEQAAWSGDVWQLTSATLLSGAAHSILHHCMPRMMNTIVPRAVFQALQARYGNIFDSIAPDFNFCFRSLEMFDSILYYDKSPLIHYALQRSNGESQARGIASKDHLDFMAELKGKSYSYAAPIPEIQTVGNAIMHEYCIVRDQTGSEKLPPIDRASYLSGLAGEVSQLENPELRRKMRTILAEHGWKEQQLSMAARLLHTVRSLPGRLRRLGRFLFHPSALPLWLWTARTFGFRPPTHLLRFGSDKDALAYNQLCPRTQSLQNEPFNASLVVGGSRVARGNPGVSR